MNPVHVHLVLLFFAGYCVTLSLGLMIGPGRENKVVSMVAFAVLIVTALWFFFTGLWLVNYLVPA